VRAQLDAYLPAGKSGEPTLIVQKALNEYLPTHANDWRHKLDSQRGAVLATELKNNSAKLARWTASALLAGAQQLKLGYVSRVRARDNTAHAVLGAQTYKTAEFAKQISLFEANMWGIVSKLVAFVRTQPNGKYLLLKDPQKGVLRVFSVPGSSFVCLFVCLFVCFNNTIIR
jgi:translation initiation factor 3 subunit D